MGCHHSIPSNNDNQTNVTPKPNEMSTDLTLIEVDVPSEDDCVSEINSVDSTPLECNVIALQGSSTYLMKYLKLDNVVVTVGMIIAEIESKLCELRTMTEIDGIVLNNLLYAKFVFERLLKLDSNTFVIAMREFVDSDGNILATQLPAGYVSEDIICKSTTTDFTVVDCGTGEFKPFNVTSIADKTYRSVVATDKHDATQFYVHIYSILTKWHKNSTTDVTADLESLKSLFTQMCPNIDTMKTICIGTQKFRDLASEFNVELIIKLFEQIHTNLIFHLLTPENESLYEFVAISNAFKNGVQPQFHSSLSSDAPNTTFKLMGNIAWGNGSGQGVIGSTKFEIDIGLKTFLTDAVTVFNSSIIDSQESVINVTKKKYENVTPEVFDILVNNINDHLNTKLSE